MRSANEWTIDVLHRQLAKLSLQPLRVVAAAQASEVVMCMRPAIGQRHDVVNRIGNGDLVLELADLADRVEL